ncbi:cell wall-binding repeat-containing protein [Mesobacillus sp. AQ2]|uniref:cell wall-binding repeat-containing protein n=1 Tax=Mesobacillus sp. AQ2 TaxID=3043332 RepID=UPI0024C1F409|nr:cell wall-binding repeat-containing protein [Mesobacillus sp. AQ2]WHX40399.1 cell wall-binding repeat-containing protein [Mesobacillus sp. AQ2]
MKPITKLYSTLTTAALLTSLVFTPATLAEGPEVPDYQKELAAQQLVSTLKNRDYQPEKQTSFSALASVTKAVYANKVDYYHTHEYNFQSAGGKFTVTENNHENIDYIIYTYATGEMVYPEADGSYNLPAGNYSLAVTNFGDGEIDYRYELNGNFVGQPDLTLPALQVTSPASNEIRLAKGASTTFTVKGSTDAQYLTIESNDIAYEQNENPGSFSQGVKIEKGLNGLYMNAEESTGNAVYSSHLITLPGISRIAGKDRYEVSAGVSKQLNKWHYNTGTVVIARGDMYPDALSGGPLAAVEGAPVLLTATNSLPAAIQNQIVNLGADRAIILGGTGSVSTNVEAQLKKLGVTDIERIGGKDRFVVSADTAERVAASYGSDTAIIASGMVFPDALSASTIAGTTGMPILLVKQDGITDSVQTFIKNNPQITNYIVVGGPATVKDSVVTKIKQLRQGAYVERIGGKDRYEVAINVAKFGIENFGISMDTLTVVRGDIFPDALSGAPLANYHRGPILLTTSAKLEAKVNSFLQSYQAEIDNIHIVGGTGSVSTTAESQLNGHIR